MRKRVLVVLLVAAMVMFSFSFSALAEFKIESNIKILPMGASGDYPVVVKDDFGNIVEGILVAGMFHEHFQNKDDILSGYWLETTTQTGATFQMPPVTDGGEIFRIFSTWVDDDPLTLHHRIIWWTSNPVLPAKLSFSGFAGEIPSRAMVCCLVQNAWGNPLPGVDVGAVLGNEYLDRVSSVTDSFGMAEFQFTGGVSGETAIKAQVSSLPFVQAETYVWWGEGGGDPQPALEGGITALNAVYEDGLAVFSYNVGNTFNAKFVILDDNGNPLANERVSCLYPTWEGTTDGNGEVSVLFPVSSFVGWDIGWIWVTNSPEITLNFKIVYL
ncbi:MAG: Ig-like domain-containing protein [Candidatus Pacebacteria bacterium]|nr:Ig-like domain-containing protein [Candidatus Paceibacterota bacterium]